MDPDSDQNDDTKPPMPEVVECEFCGIDSRLRDPFTQARLRFSVERTTPCGHVRYKQWMHFGCAQEWKRQNP